MLHDIFKNHKKTVLLAGNGLAVDCILKQDAAHEGYPLKGFSTFIGVTIDESGHGYFGDSFEITLDIEDVLEVTDLIPTEGWFIQVTFPHFKNDEVEFYIDHVAIDRTLGMYLLKCSASTSKGNGCKIDRQASGGI